MTPEQINLSHRWTVTPGFKWAPGMRVYEVSDDGSLRPYRIIDDEEMVLTTGETLRDTATIADTEPMSPGTLLPDLCDDATFGVLLKQARRAMCREMPKYTERQHGAGLASVVAGLDKPEELILLAVLEDRLLELAK